MSLIEGDAYFPLFSTAEIPIDFSAAPLVPDSPGKFPPQFHARRPSFALSNLANSQTVPGNINVQNLGPLDEPLFSLFMNGADKMDLNSGFVKGLQIPEELLLQSSVVPDARKLDGMMMGMDQRQFVQMGLLPPADAMVNGDFNMVPQLPKTANGEENAANAKGSNSRKRKFIPNAVKCEAGQVPIAGGEGQPLTPEEERNMKRQRRLVKNREAAQLFRQRQKAYIQDLEKKVADLSSTNNEFRARVELLNSENKLIKEQLLYLRNFITQAVSFSFPKSPSEDGSTSSPGSLLGPLPAGLTLPPEILGAMGNMPGMALGLMGALGPIPGLPGVPNFAEALAALPQVPSSSPVSTPSTPSGSPAQPATPPNTPISNPLLPHVETNAIKLPGITPAKTSPTTPHGTVNISAISPVAVPSSIPIVPSLSTVVTSASAQTILSPVSVPSSIASLIPPPNKPLNTSQNGANAVVPDMGSNHVMVPDHRDVKVKIEK